MKIKILKKKTKEVEDFGAREWDLANREHYGESVNWEKRNFRIVVYSDTNEILGNLGLEIAAGVARINSIIVASNARRQGVGAKLMREAEKIANKEKAHKIYLETGENWVATKFYKSLGYELTGTLEKHNLKQNFVIFTKFL